MIYITTRNEDRITWNTKVTNLFRAIPRYAAVCSESQDDLVVTERRVNGGNGKTVAITGRAADELRQIELENKYVGKLWLWVSMKVVVTTKLYVLLGVTYGSFGTVVHIYYTDSKPSCVLVKFEKGTNFRYNGLPDNHLPFFLEKHNTHATGLKRKEGRRQNVTVHRIQFGLQQSYAISDYKSQSQTFPKVMIDVQPKPGFVKSESIYVMLSRNKNFDNLHIIRDFNSELLTGRVCSANLQEAMTKLKIKAYQTEALCKTIYSTYDTQPLQI